jgi:hypothetical protein
MVIILLLPSYQQNLNGDKSFERLPEGMARPAALGFDIWLVQDLRLYAGDEDFPKYGLFEGSLQDRLCRQTGPYGPISYVEGIGSALHVKIARS